ncbi:MAG: queuosine precursor transporter [Chlamydiia bacterium]|nr:queuosine precursor transporter [Chlamydiia bacterium]
MNLLNEFLFFLQVLIVVVFTLIALRAHKAALGSFIALCFVLANLFVVKQIDLFGLTVTASDVFAIGAILGLNLMQEYFGKEEAQKTVRLGFLALIFFGIMTQVHLAYTPSLVDTTHSSFVAIFSSTPRILMASFLVYYLVQKWDIWFFQRLQEWCKGKKWGLRLFLSLFVSQAMDTVLFSFLGLYGLVDSLFDIIVMSYAVKCAIILLSSPIALFSKRWVRREVT